MYRKLLLASDCRHDSLIALREGALIAQSFKASAHLLIINPETAGDRLARSISMHPCLADGDHLLALGLDRLGRLGVPATGEIAVGDPVSLIPSRVHQRGIDLIVLAHRRQSFIDRWWSGPSGMFIADSVSCSLLIARDTVTDEEFDAHLAAQPGG